MFPSAARTLAPVTPSLKAQPALPLISPFVSWAKAGAQTSAAITARPALLIVIVFASCSPTDGKSLGAECEEDPHLRIALVDVAEARERVPAFPQEHAAVGAQADAPIDRHDQPRDRGLDVVVGVGAQPRLALAEHGPVADAD